MLNEDSTSGYYDQINDRACSKHTLCTSIARLLLKILLQVAYATEVIGQRLKQGLLSVSFEKYFVSSL